MDTVNWPTNIMHETAQTMSTENDNLLNEHTQHWQKIHDANTLLPMSMQETFNTFHTSLETNLLGAVTLHQHMGQTLATSADLAGTADSAVAKTFNGFSCAR